MNLFLKRLGGFYKYRFLMEQLVNGICSEKFKHGYGRADRRV